jgi:lipoate-protein ligase A
MIILKDKKCCGNAQYIKKDRWLHHSSFLWDFNSLNMDYLKIPKIAPKYRKDRKHQDFLCSISSYFPSKENFIQKIKEELSNNFKVEMVSLKETEKLSERTYNKTTALL